MSIFGGKRPVKPADIESELNKLWLETAQHDAEVDRDLSPRVRAILANLVILVDQSADRNSVETLLTDLCLMYPSRYFLLEIDNSVGDHLETSVSSRCVLANSGKHVCSEEIYIRTSEQAAPLVPNLLLSLFRSEVPAVFLLLQNIAGEGGVAHSLIVNTAKLCERVIFDSSRLEDYGSAVRFLDSLRSVPVIDGESSYGVGGSRVIRDLAWRRLERWRALVAEQFDSPTFLEDVKGVKLAIVRSGDARNSDSEIMAGWISSRLGWSEGERRDKLRLESVPAAGKGLAEIVLDVDLHSSAEHASVSINQEGTFATMRFYRSGQLLTNRQVPYLEKGLAENVIAEILAPRMFTVYDEAVESALKLMS